MKILTDDPVAHPEGILNQRSVFDLASGGIEFGETPCRALENVLGGFGRGQDRTGSVSETVRMVNIQVVNGGGSADPALRQPRTGCDLVRGHPVLPAVVQ